VVKVCEFRVAVDWDTAVAPVPAGASDTSLYVSEAVGEVVQELECEELVTPGKRELDAEGRVAAPATGVARHVSAEEVRPSLNSVQQYTFCVFFRISKKTHCSFLRFLNGRVGSRSSVVSPSQNKFTASLTDQNTLLYGIVQFPLSQLLERHPSIAERERTCIVVYLYSRRIIAVPMGALTAIWLRGVKNSVNFRAVTPEFTTVVGVHLLVDQRWS